MESSLSYYMRDESTGTVKEFTPDELRSAICHTRKPIMFITFGSNFFRGYEPVPASYTAAEGFFDTTPTAQDIQIVLLRSQSMQTKEFMTNYTENFRQHEANPHTPTTTPNFGATLVHDIISGLIPTADSNQPEHYQQSLAQAKQVLSRCNFVGHSFGAVMNTQIGNALKALCREKTYTPEDTNA